MDNVIRFSALLLIIFNVYLTASATEVKPCPKKKHLVPPLVEISGCESPPCKLKEKTNITFVMHFKPEKDIDNVLNNVQGIIGGIAAPFVGVDGKSACGEIYESDGKTLTKCPLKNGQEYVYKNSFKIMEYYPKISVIVHWALKDNSTKNDIICFEVDAKITK